MHIFCIRFILYDNNDIYIYIYILLYLINITRTVKNNKISTTQFFEIGAKLDKMISSVPEKMIASVPDEMIARLPDKMNHI